MQTKRKKVTKYRGSKTHGGGSMKKRRGAGHRGGRGNAGSGKKGNAKTPSLWHNYPYKAKVGFTSRNAKPKTINVFELAKFGTNVDLIALGYDKLLGRGSISIAINVKTPHATAKAIKKIEAAKGKVEVVKDGSD